MVLTRYRHVKGLASQCEQPAGECGPEGPSVSGWGRPCRPGSTRCQSQDQGTEVSRQQVSRFRMDEKSGFWGVDLLDLQWGELFSELRYSNKEGNGPCTTTPILPPTQGQVEESRPQCFEICKVLPKGNLQILPKETRNRRPCAPPTISQQWS